MNIHYFGRQYGDDVAFYVDDAPPSTLRGASRTLDMKVGAPLNPATISAAQDDIFRCPASNPFQFNTSYCRTQLVAGESSESAITSQMDYLYVTEEQEQEAMQRMKDIMVVKDAAMDVSNGASTDKSKRQRLPSGTEKKPGLGRRVSDKGRIQKKSKPKPASKKGLVPDELTTSLGAIKRVNILSAKPVEERDGPVDSATSEHLQFSDEDTEDEFPQRE
ncbi:hypothetical protein EAF04_002055 [Stromatinia cepivora]|nr:hypothetical protein EAF04_002055 [Stromatinia cepivora]